MNKTKEYFKIFLNITDTTSKVLNVLYFIDTVRRFRAPGSEQRILLPTEEIIAACSSWHQFLLTYRFTKMISRVTGGCCAHSGLMFI